MSKAAKELLWIVLGVLLATLAIMAASSLLAGWIARDLPDSPIKRSVK